MSGRRENGPNAVGSTLRVPSSIIVDKPFRGTPTKVWKYSGYNFNNLYGPPVREEGADLPDRDRQNVNGKPKTKITYRLRGLPSDVDRLTAQSKLCEKLDVEDLTLHSLCDDVSDVSEKVATVTFESETPELLLTESDDGEWSMKYDDNNTLYIDSHYTGFTPLGQPESPEDYDMDFIAIHGLGGHPLGSWKDRKSTYVWLRDSLPAHYKKCRVLIYGYRARVVDSESFETIEDIASHFCELLLDVRKSERVRKKPIVFAAHSLGGLILKSTLAMMEQGPDEAKLCLRSTYAILCFGVPNQGMDTSHMLAMIEGQENLPLVIQLSKNPQSLRPLNDSFNKAFYFEDSVVLSFYETEISPTMQQGHNGKPEMTGERVRLVDYWSAYNGRSHMKEPQIPINRNHSNMVKFSKKDDIYPVVRRQFEKLTLKAATVIAQRLEGNDSTNLNGTTMPDRGDSVSPVPTIGDLPTIGNLSSSPDPSKQLVTTRINAAEAEGREKHYETTIRVLEMLNAAMMPMSTKEEREEALIWAVELGHLDSVSYIISRHTDPDTQSEEGMTVLGIAAMNGHAALVQLLIDCGANINLKDRHSRTPLFFAAGYGHLCVCKDLVRQGALLQTKIHPRAKHGALDMTPLMNAARFGQVEVAEYLLEEGADVDCQTAQGGYSAFHYAVMGSKLDILELLTERGANVDLRTSAGATPLILASVYCSQDRDQTVAQGLIYAEANINLQDNLGFTALHYAVSFNHSQLCRLLVSEGAKLSIKGPHGLTVYHLAIFAGNQRIVNILFDSMEDGELDHTYDSTSTKTESSVVPVDPSELLDDDGFTPQDLNVSGIYIPEPATRSRSSSEASRSRSTTRRSRSPYPSFDPANDQNVVEVIEEEDSDVDAPRVRRRPTEYI